VDVFRVLLRLRLGEGEKGSELREDLLASFQERAASFPPGDLVRMLAQATELEANGGLRRSAHPRLLLEMLLLRLSYLDRTVELEALLRGLGGEDPMGARSPAAAESTPSRPDRREPGTSGPVPPSGFGKHPATSGGEVPTTVDDAPPGRLPAREAWARILEDPRDLPSGVLPFLRAAVVAFPEERRIELLLPPGPGLERLEDPLAVDALKKALSSHMGDDPQLEVRELEAEEGAPARVTEEMVRNGRLRELVEKEPTLGEAVKELDLELMD
jgi:hypothetical protein